MPTYISELFDLPDFVQRGDFVLRLTEGITKPEETVRNYVVTPQLVESFNAALNLVSSAIASKSSKAAYLHGSFGSGKSHFMAILNLILHGNAAARSIPELAKVVAKHNEWSAGKKFLLVPYHFVDAKDMESALLGGYVSFVKRHHPDAPTPGVYLADSIFVDANNLRETLGDNAFFEKLSESSKKSSEGWGELSGWDKERFERAIASESNNEDRIRLVGDLVETYFSSVRGAGEFVDLDTGLSIISKHAKSLGYDVLILFLDELILWLGSRAADTAFLQREGQKLAKLVESQSADRPVPIVSFVARQRDLRDFVSENVMGVEMAKFTDILKYWEARFSEIKLEDRNLPVIAQKRILKPKSETARQLLDEAFQSTERIREEVMDVLLTSQSDRETFRKVYPFSPALVETLVAVSSLLQRERTALKVMMQLLVEQKNVLTLGEIIPVGDLFDVIAEGDEAFSDVMKKRFDDAKKLYETKLKPMLESEHGLTFADAKSLPVDDARVVALRNDDRLLKTLLLSALADNVESLRNLNADKLVALNHGTVKSPIAGQESRTVLRKLRNWASRIGEIKIGEDPPNNPSVALQITGIDTESIIKQAQTEDNAGNRRRKIRELLLEQLNIRQQDELFQSYNFNWRATARSSEIVFGNIRDASELPDSSFSTDSDHWRVIIDFPFDNEGHSPMDDLSRLQRLKQNDSSLVMAWIPSFLSQQVQKDLGKLAVLDYILTGERISDYVTHLAPAERSTAKTLLENQQRQLRQKLIGCLEACYGIANPQPGMIDSTHQLDANQHFQTLAVGFSPQTPSAANLNEAFQRLLDQALSFQFPGHPPFEPETKLNVPNLNRIYEIIEKAAQDPDGRIAVEVPHRKDVRLIANPLKLGEMHETHFLLGRHWVNFFNRKESEFRQQEGNESVGITVGDLREWMESDTPMGLPKEIQNLVIMSYAAQTNRTFTLHNSFYAPNINTLLNNLELREQSLPNQVAWETARSRAREVFSITVSSVLNANNVAKLAEELEMAAKEYGEKNKTLIAVLSQKSKSIIPNETDFVRLKTAQISQELLDSIGHQKSKDSIEAIAGVDLQSISNVAIKSSLNKLSEVAIRLDSFNLPLVLGLKSLTDERKQAAEIIQRKLVEAFAEDEYIKPLVSALGEIERDATRLLIEKTVVASGHGQSGVKTGPGNDLKFITAIDDTDNIQTKILANGNNSNLTLDEFLEIVEEIKKPFKQDESARLRINWEVYKR
jgi:hypothetical protein